MGSKIPKEEGFSESFRSETLLGGRLIVAELECGCFRGRA